jgi:hypothetical protein
VDIRSALQSVADALTDAGVPASIEPGQVAVPGAWVQARQVDQLRLDGGGNLQASVWLIAPDTGTGPALDTLADLLDVALAVLAVDVGDGEVIDTGQGVVLPHTATPLPAFRLAVDIDINPERSLT